MHCYEVIPENAVCKLYFDLEFNKPANPGADGKKMVALLIEVNGRLKFFFFVAVHSSLHSVTQSYLRNVSPPFLVTFPCDFDF